MKKLIISLLFLSLLCTQASAANLEELRTKYDAVSSFSGGTAVVLSGYKYGLMDEQGNEIIPIGNYDISTGRYRESGWVLLPNNLHGYLEYSDNGSTFTIANASGTILQKTNYTEVSSYHTSNYIVVKQNGKYGMISADTMKVILPIKFTKISQYNNDIVVLEEGTKNRYYYNITAKKKLFDVIPGDWLLATPYGFYRILTATYDREAESEFEFINLDGSKITKLGRGHIMNASSYEKYYLVGSKNGGIRLFDDKGKLIYSKKLTLQKDWKLSDFAKITVDINGLIGVNITPGNKDKQVWVFINPKTGKVEKTFDYRVTTKISDNSYIIQSNKYQGMIDKNFKTIAPLKYAVEVLKYTKNYIILADSKTYNKGVLDLQGNIKVPFKYNSIVPINDEQFMVYLNGKAGIMDINGKIIIPIEYDRVEPIDAIQNAFHAEKKGKKYSIYTDGKIYIK